MKVCKTINELDFSNWNFTFIWSVRNPPKNSKGLSVRPFLLAIAVLFCISACDPKPCLKSPSCNVNIEWITKSILKSDTFGILVFPNGNRIQVIRAEVSKATDTTVRISVPFQSRNSQFTIIRTDSVSTRRLSLQMNPELRYAGETCGFYEGFGKLSYSVESGNFRKLQLVNSNGDSTRKVHLRVYE